MPSKVVIIIISAQKHTSWRVSPALKALWDATLAGTQSTPRPVTDRRAGAVFQAADVAPCWHGQQRWKIQPYSNAPPEKARKSFRRFVFRLRMKLGTGRLRDPSAEYLSPRAANEPDLTFVHREQSGGRNASQRSAEIPISPTDKSQAERNGTRTQRGALVAITSPGFTRAFPLSQLTAALPAVAQSHSGGVWEINKLELKDTSEVEGKWAH